MRATLELVAVIDPQEVESCGLGPHSAAGARAPVTVSSGCRLTTSWPSTATPSPSLAQGIRGAAMSPAVSGGRTLEPVTEEDF